jgi:hypothetical protein
MTAININTPEQLQRIGYKGLPAAVADAYANSTADLGDLLSGAIQAYKEGYPQNLRTIISLTARFTFARDWAYYRKRLDIFDVFRDFVIRSQAPTDTARSLLRDVTPADRQRFIDEYLARETEFPWAADAVFTKALLDAGANKPNGKTLQNIQKFVENVGERTDWKSRAENILTLLKQAPSFQSAVRVA